MDIVKILTTLLVMFCCIKSVLNFLYGMGSEASASAAFGTGETLLRCLCHIGWELTSPFSSFTLPSFSSINFIGIASLKMLESTCSTALNTAKIFTESSVMISLEKPSVLLAKTARGIDRIGPGQQTVARTDCSTCSSPDCQNCIILLTYSQARWALYCIVFLISHHHKYKCSSKALKRTAHYVLKQDLIQHLHNKPLPITRRKLSRNIYVHNDLHRALSLPQNETIVRRRCTFFDTPFPFWHSNPLLLFSWLWFKLIL